MNKNIEFSIVPNKTNTKFKIAWTVKLGEYPTTKTLSREFGSTEAAQEFLDNNGELLAQKIRERISKIAINLNKIDETKEETTEVEETEEKTTEVEETEEKTEEVEETEEETEEVEETEEKTTEVEETEEKTTEVEETEEETTEVEETEEVEESKELIYVEEYNLPEESETMVLRKTKKKHLPSKIISAILALVIAFVGGYHIRKYTDKNSDTPSDEPSIESPSDEPSIESPSDEPSIDIPNDEITNENTLTNEAFATLTANFIKLLQDKNVNVTTEDITKFVSIVNIDRLVEENKELASALYQGYTKEQYIQDSANIIGRTCQYNAKVFNTENSTENFVRVSESLYGEQKEQLQIIESYVDRIAVVSHDAEKVNEIVSELIASLLTGDLQNLDYGVQFAMQSSIELIRSYIAKDVLTEENVNALTEITRLDVTEIMYMYDNVNGLTGTAKTLK